MVTYDNESSISYTKITFTQLAVSIASCCSYNLTLLLGHRTRGKIYTIIHSIPL